MKDFLRENWLWIVIPFVLVIGAILALIYLGQGETIKDFDYPI